MKSSLHGYAETFLLPALPGIAGYRLGCAEYSLVRARLIQRGLVGHPALLPVHDRVHAFLNRATSFASGSMLEVLSGMGVMHTVALAGQGQGIDAVTFGLGTYALRVLLSAQSRKVERISDVYWKH